MSVSYDVFIGSFLEKVTERDLLSLEQSQRDSVVIGYMKRAISGFRKICQYDFSTTGDDETRVFNVDVPDDDLTEIADIVSEGMVVQWLKPYVYKQELLENATHMMEIVQLRTALSWQVFLSQEVQTGICTLEGLLESFMLQAMKPL